MFKKLIQKFSKQTNDEKEKEKLEKIEESMPEVRQAFLKSLNKTPVSDYLWDNAKGVKNYCKEWVGRCNKYKKLVYGSINDPLSDYAYFCNILKQAEIIKKMKSNDIEQKSESYTTALESFLKLVYPFSDNNRKKELIIYQKKENDDGQNDSQNEDYAKKYAKISIFTSSKNNSKSVLEVLEKVYDTGMTALGKTAETPNKNIEDDSMSRNETSTTSQVSRSSSEMSTQPQKSSTIKPMPQTSKPQPQKSSTTKPMSQTPKSQPTKTTSQSNQNLLADIKAGGFKFKNKVGDVRAAKEKEMKEALKAENLEKFELCKKSLEFHKTAVKTCSSNAEEDYLKCKGSEDAKIAYDDFVSFKKEVEADIESAYEIAEKKDVGKFISKVTEITDKRKILEGKYKSIIPASKARTRVGMGNVMEELNKKRNKVNS